MDLDDVRDVYNEVIDLDSNIQEFIKYLILICRSYNYTFIGEKYGTIKLNGFNGRIKIDMSGHPRFRLKYKKQKLVNVMYSAEKNEPGEIILYTLDYYLNREEFGLIKEFVSAIKNKIEVINISIGDII